MALRLATMSLLEPASACAAAGASCTVSEVRGPPKPMLSAFAAKSVAGAVGPEVKFKADEGPASVAPRSFSISLRLLAAWS